jgi:hypothetical protein
MGLSGQRHAPAALLPPGKGPPVPTVQEAKFLIRKIEVTTEPECTAIASTSVTSFVEQDKSRAKKKISKINHRKYDEAYTEWEFSCTPDGMQPLLQRHFNSYHNSMKVNSKDFLFNAKRQDLSTQQAKMRTKVNISLKCLQASYAISLRAAKCKTPHTVVQELVVPSAIEIASIMVDDKIVSQI